MGMGKLRYRGNNGGGGMKSGLLLVFCLTLLLLSWDSLKTDAAAVDTEIPQNSIRLRILADSDNPADQLVKRRVRDAVVEQMNGWVASLDNPQSLDEARAVIQEHLPEVEQQVAATLAANGESYSYKVELGTVPFPAKLYGGKVYPAGDYEALRITLGSGQGQNWWCVLFPPLCFIDGGSGDALAKSEKASQDGSAGTAKVSKASKDKADKTGEAIQTVSAAGAAGTTAAAANGDAPAVHFFLWDMLKGLMHWIAGLFG